MSIRVHNFMGRLGWEMQKHFPMLSANAYLKLQMTAREKNQKAYIKMFNGKEIPPQPLVVNLETINRCNGSCAFCTANKHAEKRPYVRMEDDLFYSIIDQLADWGFKGHLTLYGNNEPWLDTRIVDMHKYCREKLPDSFIFMSTNGILLDIDKVKAISPYINQLVINNYCEDMKLYDNVQKIHDYVVAHEEEFKDVEILIQMRYVKAVLTNRAGSSPNKAATEKIIKETCLMPYTDMFIFPDGRMGLCCCDNLEATTLADLTKEPLVEAWNSKAYQAARKLIENGRQNHPFCKHCDFIDAGLRMDAVDDVLKGRPMRGARQYMMRRQKNK